MTFTQHISAIGAVGISLALAPDVRAQEVPAMPVFLDGPTVVHAALRQPATLASLEGTFSVRTTSGTVAVSAINPASPPVVGSHAPAPPGSVVIAGTLQAALGGAPWDPSGANTRMTEIRPGVFELVVALPKGNYEYKVARGGGWDENYGAGFTRSGSNISLDVPKDGTVVRFDVDFNARNIADSINDATGAPPPTTAPAPPPVDKGTARYDELTLTLARAITPAEVAAPLTLVSTDGTERTVYARDILSDAAYVYTRDDLGPRWTRKATTFKVWSPVSTSADLLLYRSTEDENPKAVKMERGDAGVWTAKVEGDLDGTFYQYRFESHGMTRVAPDINCFAASADSRRSMVIDLSRTNPRGWPGKAIPRRRSQTDSIIYEMHVRDFTALPSSGVRPEWRGKYPGAVERGTHVPGGTQVTGIDYLKQLGITDVHLLPIQNSSAGRRGDYSWGYATTLFNVPEEGYCSTPDDPASVIRETKAMVAGYHSAGIGVVMDVVYNHTWPGDGPDSAFQQTVPYYYVRSNNRGDILNESGVGNALADERPMARKFVRDSLLYWMREYHIDGFRFDLIGMHFPASVKDWETALRAVRPDVLLYGEPWTGGGPTRFGKGAQRGMRVAVFNDDFRNTIRGVLDGPAPGFAMGGGASYAALKRAVSGCVSLAPGDGAFAASPEEAINYVSAHDNLTLWDKIKITMPNASRDEQARAVKLANAAVLLSQGVPFLEGGVEIGREKDGDRDTYNRNDEVNGYHWERASEYKDVCAYLRGLITLRRSSASLRLADAASIKSRMHVWEAGRLPDKSIVYELDGSPGDKWMHILVALHGSRDEVSLELPDGTWSVLVDGEHAGRAPLRTVHGKLSFTPLSAFVLVRQ